MKIMNLARNLSFEISCELQRLTISTSWIRRNSGIRCLKSRDFNSSVPVRYIPKKRLKNADSKIHRKGTEKKDLGGCTDTSGLKYEVSSGGGVSRGKFVDDKFEDRERMPINKKRFDDSLGSVWRAEVDDSQCEDRERMAVSKMRFDNTRQSVRSAEVVDNKRGDEEQMDASKVRFDDNQGSVSRAEVVNDKCDDREQMAVSKMRFDDNRGSVWTGEDANHKCREQDQMHVSEVRCDDDNGDIWTGEVVDYKCEYRERMPVNKMTFDNDLGSVWTGEVVNDKYQNRGWNPVKETVFEGVWTGEVVSGTSVEQNKMQMSKLAFDNGEPDLEETDHSLAFEDGELLDETEGDEEFRSQNGNTYQKDQVDVGKTYQDGEKLAIELLAARGYTAVELRKKLHGKRFPQAIVDALIENFKSRGLINDNLYAETFSRSRWSSSTWGPRRIKQALFKKGISQVVAEKAIKQVFEDGESDGCQETRLGMSKLAMDRLIVQASKQWQRGRDVPKETQKSRIIRWLQYRGFNWDVISVVLKKLETRCSDHQ